MAYKWRVSVDDQFLGHYYGKTPEEAVKKAVSANYNYRLENFNMAEHYTAKKCNSNRCVTFLDEDMERICNE